MKQLTKAEILQKVTTILVETLGVDEVDVTLEVGICGRSGDKGPLGDASLGADSLDAVELVMTVEEEFGIDISDDEAERMRTVGDAVAWLFENQPEA